MHNCQSHGCLNTGRNTRSRQLHATDAQYDKNTRRIEHALDDYGTAPTMTGTGDTHCASQVCASQEGCEAGLERTQHHNDKDDDDSKLCEVYDTTIRYVRARSLLYRWCTAPVHFQHKVHCLLLCRSKNPDSILVRRRMPRSNLCEIETVVRFSGRAGDVVGLPDMSCCGIALARRLSNTHRHS